MKAGHLTLKQEGVEVTKLPQAEKDLLIYKHKIVDNSTADQRLILFHVVFENERHVVSVSYLKKRKLLELHFRKKKEISKGKNLS